MDKKSNPIIIISVVTGILLAVLVGMLVFFNFPAQRIRRMLKSANKYIAEENYDEAILTLKKMIEIDPKNEELYVLLANTYEKNGDIDKEIEFLQEAVTLMPENRKISEILLDVNSEVTISETGGRYRESARLSFDAPDDRKLDESKYHFNEWVNEADGKHFHDTEGKSVTGWKQIGGLWYLFDKAGVMLTGLQDDKGKTYYLGTDGIMLTGWHEINGKRYYFDENGVMLKNLWIDDIYYVGKDGAMLVETVTPATETKARTSDAAPRDIYSQITGFLPDMITVDANYIKNYYGIDASQLEGYAFAMAEDVTHADTVAILKAKNASRVPALASQLSAVQQQKAQELQDYMPDQYQIVVASSVKTFGNYVYLIMSPNAAAIEQIIVDTLTPTEKTRAQTSDADPRDIYSKVTGLLPSMITVDANYIANYYGIDASQLESYVFAMAEDVTHADTVAILKAKNASRVPALASQLSAVQQQKAQELQDYMPDQYQIVVASSVKTFGNYVYLVMSPNAAAIERTIVSNIG
ncbi:DUF4358 domain-containing protein [Oribacterium sp. FC2011]|uniref:DUF4358 domain-containing protein n=1 Tax=Oribacterium sp. FC2011 TaxID=1408311 RepID=UPI0006791148|nr:DUF4358 domain-containing protein [Oribacterium sp. FC2011]